MTTFLFSLPLLASVLMAQSDPSPLRVSMISLGVTDMARSMQFYRDTLGLQLVTETEPGQVAILRAGEITIALNRPLGQASKQIAGAVEVIFSVEHVDSSYKGLVEKGCPFRQSPREIFSGTWAATFTDPDGHLLTLLGPR